MSSANNIINITNCIFSKNMATKSNTYLGTDYSQSGNFAGGIYGAKSYMIVTNTIFGESYSPKGYL